MSKVAIYKSAAAEFLDDFFSGDDDQLTANYDYAIALLEQEGVSLSDIIDQFASDRDGPADAQSIAEHWLKRPNVDRIMRASHLYAMRTARNLGAPMDTLWVTGASDEFEVHVSEGPRRVTVLVCIPDRDAPKSGSRRARSSSHAFSAQDRRRTSGHEPGTEVVDEGDTPIVRTQKSAGRGSR
jgi:hypothetical protein